MSAPLSRPSRPGAAVAVLALALVAFALSGCAVGPVYGGGYDFGADYYGPVGIDYGGWGGDYRVGPFRGAQPYRGGRGAHAWHGASGARSIPSIAGGMRGGGFHGGGFHGGGGSRGGGGGHGR